LPGKQAEFAPFQRTLKSTDMKQGIHPEYREVVFQDTSTDFAILTRSTIESRDTIKWEDGNEYPLVKLEVSSASHPFYTGKQHVLQSARQVDKFRERYGKK
jgi:large subunit ribosomal protein L31